MFKHKRTKHFWNMPNDDRYLKVTAYFNWKEPGKHQTNKAFLNQFPMGL